MCGFVAIVGPGARVPTALVQEMRDRLTHRGPDGKGLWQKEYSFGSISLGFRRLAIIDTRRVSDQPMISHNGKAVIAFNGEIYNFVELRLELEGLGRVFHTRSDTEVLLQAYEHWGEHAVDRLNGMFAFAIWDESLSQLFVARDRFGEKPLFVTRLPDGKLAFASEIKALLAHPDIQFSYDFQAFSDVLKGDILFGQGRTLFKGIKQFPSAHCMMISISGEVLFDRRYWNPNYTILNTNSDVGQIQHFVRSSLERSVSMRMRSDVPVTACLSGGLDSSSLVALLCDNSDDSTGSIESTISVRFPDDPTIDEGYFIDLVLGSTGLKGHSVLPTAEDLMSDLRQLHWHHETIIPGTSMYLEWSLMRHARQLGYKVIIDGQGADEVFGGYSFYLRAFQAELATRGLIGLSRAIAMGKLRDQRLRKAAYNFINSSRRFNSRESLRIHEYLLYICKWIPAYYQLYGGDGIPSPKSLNPLRFELALNLLRTSLPSNLYSGDRNSMAHGIECRYPFLDYQLVDLANQLPDKAYINNAWSKYVLRKVMEHNLPSEITWRVDKVGFAAPQDRWLASKDLQSWIEDRVFDSSLNSIPGYSRVDTLYKWEKMRTGNYSNHQSLWRLASAAELIDMGRTGIWRSLDAKQQPIFSNTNSHSLKSLKDGAFFKQSNNSSLGKIAWIISYTPVSKEPRVIRQARALEKAGWSIVVFGFDGKDSTPDSWNFVSLNQDLSDKSFLPSLIRYSLRILFVFGTLAANSKFFPPLRRLGARLAHFASYKYFWPRRNIRDFADTHPLFKPSILLCHDYFTLDIALQMGFKFKVPVVLDAHEYSLGHYSHSRNWIRWHKSVVKELQDQYLPLVKAVTTVSEGISNLIACDHSLHVAPKVIRSLPYYTPQCFRATGKVITVLYHGEIYPARALHVAIRSLPMWRPEFRFVVRGYSDPDYACELLSIAAELGVSDRFDIEPPVPFDQIISSANSADIGYFVHLDTSPQRRFVLPNKFFEYVMAGLGVLVSDLPEMSRLVKHYEIGRLVSCCDELTIANAINSLDRDGIDQMKKNSIEAAKILNWELEEQALMAVYQESLK